MPDLEDLSTPTCFIASSREGQPIAELVADAMAATVLVDPWWDAFALNRSTLDSLLYKSAFHDYAIVVLSADDFTTSRRRRITAPRDNVIFEIGVFFGQLGVDRAFVLASKDTKIPSDLDGIAINLHDGTEQSIRKECEKILSKIAETERSKPPLRLPSTALALGYWKNFVKPLFARIQERKRSGGDISLTPYGAEAPTSTRLANVDVSLEVWCPPTLNDLEFSNLLLRTAQHQLGVADVPGDRRNLSLNYIPSEDASRITLVDFPKTLTATAIAVDAMFTSQVLEGEARRARLELREIRHFMQTLAWEGRGLIKMNTLKLVPLAH